METAMSVHSAFLSFSRKIQAERTAVSTVVKRPMVFVKFAAIEEYDTRRNPVQRARKTAMDTPLENEAKSPIQNVFAENPPDLRRIALLVKKTESAVRKIAPSARNKLHTGEASPVLTT